MTFFSIIFNQCFSKPCFNIVRDLFLSDDPLNKSFIFFIFTMVGHWTLKFHVSRVLGKIYLFIKHYEQWGGVDVLCGLICLLVP